MMDGWQGWGMEMLLSDALPFKYGFGPGSEWGIYSFLLFSIKMAEDLKPVAKDALTCS